MTVTKQGGHASTATERMNSARSVKADAITRELCLVSIVSRFWPSCLMPPLVEQQRYPFVCIVNTPAGRLAYRVHADELPLFSHLQRVPNDGVNAEAKLPLLMMLATEQW